MTFFSIFNALNINKAHGHDEISVRMIKDCNEAFVKPLALTYTKFVLTHITGVFPDIWKKSNIVPICYTRGDKQGLH